jgi:uncharacterized membrane protein YkoI
MMLGRRRVIIAAIPGMLLVLGAGAAVAVSASNDDDVNEVSVAPGTIDDGKDLLPQAKITLEQAIAAAQGAESGSIGEVDLEYYDSTLVFNVDVGDHDVKVDASNGSIVASDSDD